MSKKSTTLQQLFPAEWREDMPGNLVQLMAAEYEDLDETARALRKLAVELVHSFERQPVLTAEAAMRLIEKHHLPVLRNRWIFHVLTKDKERMYDKTDSGGMRQRNAVFKGFPAERTATEKAALPEGGSYLIAYGGSPEDVLSNEEWLEKFHKLRRAVNVADVIFWHEDGDVATFYSLRAGHGRRGGQTVEFPDPQLMERWWNG